MNKLPIPESYWVEENRFLAGEYPGSFNAEEARHRMDLFLEAGINTFFDLTQAHEHRAYDEILKEQAYILGEEAQYYRFGIRDHGIPGRETMTAILDEIDNALNNDRNVYVHCWGGVGRTGIVVGCHLVRRGKTGEQALATVNQLYKTRPANSFYPRSPETDEQIQFVLDWRETPSPDRRSKQNFREG